MADLIRFNCEQIHDMSGLKPEKIGSSTRMTDLTKILAEEEGNKIYLIKEGATYKYIDSKEETINWINTNYGTPGGFVKTKKVETKKVEPTKVSIEEEAVVDLDDYSSLRTNPIPF